MISKKVTIVDSKETIKAKTKANASSQILANLSTDFL